MSYREPAENQSRANRSAAEERLQRQLEDETRAREEKERHERARAERARQREPTPEQLERAKAHARCLECYPLRVRDLLLVFVFYGALLCLAVFFNAASNALITGLLVVLAILLGAAWLSLSPRWQLRSEERRLARLPFRVLGFVEALERDLPYHSLHATMTITLRPEVGEVREDLLLKLAQRVYPPASATLRHEDDRVYCVLRSEDLTDSQFCRTVSEKTARRGHKYRLWMCQALDKVALPLSEVYPIKSVKF
jgi:hypothetical protein